MQFKKKKAEKKYNFIQVLKCTECKSIAETPGPCEKCKNDTFSAEYIVQEIQ